jgi:hypothetical protein
MDATPIFLFKGMRRSQIPKRGRKKILKSDSMLIAAVEIMAAFALMHLPLIMGFQIFSRGTQAKTKTNVTEMYTTALAMIRAQLAQ